MDSLAYSMDNSTAHLLRLGILMHFAYVAVTRHPGVAAYCSQCTQRSSNESDSSARRIRTTPGRQQLLLMLMGKKK